MTKVKKEETNEHEIWRSTKWRRKKEKVKGRRRKEEWGEEGGTRRKWNKQKKSNKKKHEKKEPDAKQRKSTKSDEIGRNSDAPKTSKNDERSVAVFNISIWFWSGCPQTTSKIVLSGRQQKTAPKNPMSWKHPKTGIAAFSNMRVFWGPKTRPRNPYSRSVSWGHQKGGFNSSPLNCQREGSINHPPCIYIYMYLSTRYVPPLTILPTEAVGPHIPPEPTSQDPF